MSDKKHSEEISNALYECLMNADEADKASLLQAVKNYAEQSHSSYDVARKRIVVRGMLSTIEEVCDSEYEPTF